MLDNWHQDINDFLKLANKFSVRLIMVGGGAVNFHGYQRHSADIDFWIEPSEENFERLLSVFQAMDYDIDDFPDSVKNKEQNISLKFSPYQLNLELITNFSVNKTFEDAYSESVEAQVNDETVIKWRVLSYDDLITSKIKSNRPKDVLDIQELERIRHLGG